MGKQNHAAVKRTDSKGRVLKHSEHQRADGKYYFDATIDGKRMRACAEDLDHLREKEERFYTDCTNKPKNDYNLITVNDAFELWAEIKSGLRENTKGTYQYLYRHYVQGSSIGKSELMELRKSQIRRYYKTLAEKKGLSVNTIDGIHTVLRQVLQTAVDDGYLVINPAEKALFELRRAHEYEREEKYALTTMEEQRFLSFLGKSREFGHWKNLFTVLFETGMRVGELTGLIWDDIDFEREEITVGRALCYYCRDGKCGYHIHMPKTKNGIRTIPMMGKTKEALQAERKTQETDGQESSMIIDGLSDFVFLNRYGRVYHGGTINRAIRRIVNASNAQIDAGEADERYRIRPFSVHSTRHTFTTKAVLSGMPIKALQKILGHTDIRTSLDIYCHITDHMKQNAKKEYELFLKWRDSQYGTT